MRDGEMPRRRRLVRLFALIVRDHAVNDIFGARSRSKIDKGLDLGGIRYASMHILKALLIGFIIRNVTDRRSTAGHRFYQLGQIANRDLMVAADVEDLS